MRKHRITAGGAVGCSLILLIGVGGCSSKRSPAEATKSWNDQALTASYAGSKLIELDNAHSSLVLSYDVENNTDADYHLGDGNGLAVMARLRSNGSLSQEESVRLKYPVFLPARQSSRLAIEITRPFAWPAKNDPALAGKLKDFVRRRLEDSEGFVLFDEASHCQVELPGAWEQLQPAAKKG